MVFRNWTPYLIQEFNTIRNKISLAVFCEVVWTMKNVQDDDENI
jgi:hypothetical protein